MFKPTEREYRTAPLFKPVEQSEDDKILRIQGCPIVFNVETVLWECDGIQYKEKIDAHALDRCDLSDFIFNRNHGQNDSTVFARSKNKTILSDITASGMSNEMLLDADDQRHVYLFNDIRKELIDKMSFAFTVAESDYNPDTHLRTILKIKKLYDISAVDFPAYNQTALTLARDFFSAEHEKEFRNLEEIARRKRLIIKTYF